MDIDVRVRTRGPRFVQPTRWHRERERAISAVMADPAPHKRPFAGGFLIVLGILVGVVAGLIAGQPTIGFLIGGGVGAALALALYLRARA